MARPRPLLAPDPTQDTTADVPRSAGYSGPLTTTRETYRPSYAPRTVAGGMRPSVNGMPLTDDQIGQLQQYFGALADEDARRFGVTSGLQGRELDIRQRAADADRKARLKEIQMRLAEDRRQFDLNYGLDRDRFGADILKTGASMRGPLSWIQGDMYAQGSQAFSPYLQSLRSGQPVQYGGGTGTTGSPVPLTVGTLATAMSGGGTGVPNGGAGPTGGAGTDAYGRPNLSPEARAAVDATAKVYERGIANSPLGWYENMTQDQKDAFTSQSDYLGRNTRSEVEYYKRSRPGQRSGALA